MLSACASSAGMSQLRSKPYYFSCQMIIWGGPCKVLTVSRDKGSDLWVDYSAIES